MKQLISATLSEEAAKIYNEWEKQKKSAILSEMIVRKDSIYKHNEALIKQKSNLQRLMSNAMVQIYLNDPKHPLVKELNECLEGTIYYQYWNPDEYGSKDNWQHIISNDESQKKRCQTISYDINIVNFFIH